MQAKYLFILLVIIIIIVVLGISNSSCMLNKCLKCFYTVAIMILTIISLSRILLTLIRRNFSFTYLALDTNHFDLYAYYFIILYGILFQNNSFCCIMFMTNIYIYIYLLFLLYS